MIPWVVVLLVSIGLGALVPVRSVGKKEESRGEVAVPASEHGQALGRVSHSSDHQVLPSYDVIGAPSVASSRVCIDSRGDRLVVASPRGAVQGRAPPVELES
jgi:hypothetical protein